MALPQQRVKTGDPLKIPAQDWNAVLAATRYVEALQRATGGGPSGGPIPNPVIVKVKNSSGSDVAAGGVLGIEGPIFPPSGETVSATFILQIDLRGITPTDEHRGAFVVTLDPLAVNAIGRAVVAGAAVVKVNAADAAAEEFRFAEVDESLTSLKAVARGSARIIWRQSGTGEKWAMVNLAAGDVSELAYCTLESDGGSDGGDVGPTDWTYTVTVDGVEIATGKSPRRPDDFRRDEATEGIVRITGFDVDLLVAFEATTSYDCPEEEE